MFQGAYFCECSFNFILQVNAPEMPVVHLPTCRAVLLLMVLYSVFPVCSTGVSTPPRTQTFTDNKTQYQRQLIIWTTFL